MPMDEQECSFLDFINFLQAKYGDISAQGFCRLVDIGNEQRQLEQLILREWLEGVSPLVSLNVPGYLCTICLPYNRLEIFFRNIPTAIRHVPKENRWMQLCLYMTPPFQTMKSNYVRDLRPPSTRRLPYRNITGLPCRDRAKLIETITDALLVYEIHVKSVIRDTPQYIVAHMKDGIQGTVIAERLFGELRDKKRLPVALKGFPITKKVQNSFQMVRTIMQGLVSEYDSLFPQWSEVGCPNRPLALDQFLDSQCQSRLSHAWWCSIFNEKGVIQACQLRPIGIFTTS